MKKPAFKCYRCGATRNGKNKLFKDGKALKAHQRQCGLRTDDSALLPANDEDDEFDFTMTDLIADDDMPDGAYFALAGSLGEGPYAGGW